VGDGFTGFKGPVRTRKDPQGPVRCPQTSGKRVGAIQVFCPMASKVGDANAGEYRLSKIFDDVSLCQSPYSRQRIPWFYVATAYKTKANKVRPVDPGETDGSKPGGTLDWFERSKADDIPSQPGLYSDWITPKFSDIQRGSRLTDERIKSLIVGDSL
jgi:hypothetical protein